MQLGAWLFRGLTQGRPRSITTLAVIPGERSEDPESIVKHCAL
jgi:hypothetical protein